MSTLTDRQIVFLDQHAFMKLEKNQQNFMKQRMSDPLFAEFIRLQREAAKEQLLSLDPDEGSAEEYHTRARSLGLVVKFWTEFEMFAQQ